MVITITSFCEVGARKNGLASTDQRVEQGA
jgi:hypothetical protein